MGKDQNENSPKRKKPVQGTQSSFLYSSFHPTETEKKAIANRPLSDGAIDSALIALMDQDLVVSVKLDRDGDVMVLTIRQNVPYGSPCAACSMRHRDATRLISMLVWWVEHHLNAWLTRPETDQGASADW